MNPTAVGLSAGKAEAAKIVSTPPDGEIPLIHINQREKLKANLAEHSHYPKNLPLTS
jgi:hypothetical protein